MNEKILTIAIPTYNLGEYLKRNVEEISLAAHFESVDVLIIDDGSTDNTPEIADELVKAYPNSVRCIHKDNGHYGSAVNAAIDGAKGAFFKIVDADDRVCPSGLDGLVEALAGAAGLDMLVSCYAEMIENEANRVIEFKLLPHQMIRFDGLSQGPFPMHALTYRTSLLKENGIRLSEGVAYTDVEYVVFPSIHVEAMMYLPVVVYLYTLGRDGQSVELAQMVKGIGQHMVVLTALLDWYEDCKFPLKNGSREYASKRIATMYNAQVVFSMLSPDYAKLKPGIIKLNERVKRQPEIYKHCLKNKDSWLLEKSGFRAYGALSILHRLKKRLMRNLNIDTN